MKANIKDDQNGQKKDSAKLATIKKSEKAGNSKISETMKIAINQAVIDATSQTLDATPSTSNENLFSHFTNPQKAFTPIASTFTSGLFSKDPVLLGSASNYCQSFGFVQPCLVPTPTRILQTDFISNTSDSHAFSSGVQVIEENSTTLNDSVNSQKSSTIVKPSMQINLVSNTTNSPQIVTAKPVQKSSITLKNSLNNQKSLVTVRPSMKINEVKINSPQIVVGSKLIEENTTSLGESLNIKKTLITTKPTMKNNEVTRTINSPQTVVGSQLIKDSVTTLSDSSLVPNVVNLSQSLAAIEPMEENGMFDDDLLETQEPLNNSSMQNNSSGNLNSEEFVIVVETEEQNNTRQVSITPAQPRLKNVLSVKSSDIQKLPPSSPSPVLSSKNLKQFSMSTQTEASDTTSSVTKNDNNILNTQSTPTRGVKRKAEEIENKGKNPVNSQKQKKNKKKKKFVNPYLFKKFKKSNKGQQNFAAVNNAKSLMCAIVEEQYPNMPPLTDVHLGIIRNVIKEKIDNLPFGVFVPKFMHSFIKNGVILVECADNNSQEWLKDAITSYNPEEGVFLKVIPPEAINQYYPASIFVQDEVNAVDVLRRMQKQNSDISITNWQYLSMIIVKESTPGITINVGIPATSIAQLKEKNFKLFHAMNQVTVIMKVKVPF